MNAIAERTVTAEWIGTLLAGAEPGITVRSAKVTESIPGASSKIRVELTSDRQGVPARIMLKPGWEPHSPHMRIMHDNEMHAYRDLVPTLPVNTARCLYAGPDQDGNAMVALEDLSLRDVSFLSLQHPIDIALAERFLEAMARFHARWWNDATLDSDRFAWLSGSSGEGDVGHYFDILTDPAHFARYIDSPRGAAMPMALHDAQRIRRAHAAMRARFADWGQTALHGDLHLGNLYRDADGAPGFLDWQPRKGPWSVDVSYFLIAALDVADRRRFEAGLLRHYCACLANEGVTPPSFEEAWDAYRQSVPWGLLIWLLNSNDFQTEARNIAASTRFGMAMIDHDVFGLLGV